ncbi:UNVERIFIED_CONTAM: PepSY domain-containing protein, partial [Prevotella sp. 15_C9]
LDNSGKIRGWIYSVHVGSWGGMLTRILTFVAALIGASLPLTGYYLWIRKKIKRRPASPKFLSAED